MVRLTIDGHCVQVPEGTTVLDAARWLGIRVPTLCHVTGIDAAASCFVCAVQIEGRRTLTPSCAISGRGAMRRALAPTPPRQLLASLRVTTRRHQGAGLCVPCQSLHGLTNRVPDPSVI